MSGAALAVTAALCCVLINGVVGPMVKVIESKSTLVRSGGTESVGVSQDINSKAKSGDVFRSSSEDVAIFGPSPDIQKGVSFTDFDEFIGCQRWCSETRERSPLHFRMGRRQARSLWNNGSSDIVIVRQEFGSQNPIGVYSKPSCGGIPRVFPFWADAPTVNFHAIRQNNLFPFGLYLSDEHISSSSLMRLPRNKGLSPRSPNKFDTNVGQKESGKGSYKIAMNVKSPEGAPEIPKSSKENSREYIIFTITVLAAYIIGRLAYAVLEVLGIMTLRILENYD